MPARRTRVLQYPVTALGLTGRHGGFCGAINSCWHSGPRRSGDLSPIRARVARVDPLGEAVADRDTGSEGWVGHASGRQPILLLRVKALHDKRGLARIFLLQVVKSLTCWRRVKKTKCQQSARSGNSLLEQEQKKIKSGGTLGNHSMTAEPILHSPAQTCAPAKSWRAAESWLCTPSSSPPVISQRRSQS